MFRYFARKPFFASAPTVAFATSCWEKDWQAMLGPSRYLLKKQIVPHRFAFAERILVINNVNEPARVQEAVDREREQAGLTQVVWADAMAEEVLAFFRLERRDFRGPVSSDWLYYNALAPLSALYACRSTYLLYMTGDVFLKESIHWIGQALEKMERNPRYKVANLTWNHAYEEARRESIGTDGSFFVADEGFSDQMFLVRCSDFRAPIYGEIRMDAAHYPRGDVFEKRCFSYMKNRGWQRITYRHGSYIHQNF